MVKKTQSIEGKNSTFLAFHILTGSSHLFVYQLMIKTKPNLSINLKYKKSIL